MINISSSLKEYDLLDIRKLFDLRISELSNDGVYDFLSYPSYTMQSPYTSGPFWKGDMMIIKWNYNEPLNDLIPFTDIYLMSGNDKKILLFEKIPTKYKNVSWIIDKNLNENEKYYIRVETKFDNEIIYSDSKEFTVKSRKLFITSRPPKEPIVANRGEKYTLQWNGEGIGDVFRIELLYANVNKSIYLDSMIGTLVKNPDSSLEIIKNENEDSFALNKGYNIIKVIEDKYYTSDNTYVYTVDAIDNYSIDKIRLRVIDLKNSIDAISNDIDVMIPYISIVSIGRQIVADSILSSSLVGVGTGNAILSAFAFSPNNFKVKKGQSFEFSYTSTNAIEVILTKQSDFTYYKRIPLAGNYKIENINEDTTYVLMARDSNYNTKSINFDIKIKQEDEDLIYNGDITTFTKYQLLKYAVGVMNEVLISGDSIIDPAAPVNSKVNYYTTEANQVTEDSSENVVWYLLKSLNEEVLRVFIEGVNTTPKVILFDGTKLKNKVVKLSNEIGRREGIIISTPVKISGKILDTNGFPVVGAEVTATALNVRVPTDLQGKYILEVNYNYTGSITPFLSGYEFNPSSINYFRNPILGDISGQDFIAIQSGSGGVPPNNGNFKIVANGLSDNNKNIMAYVYENNTRKATIIKNIESFYDFNLVKGNYIKIEFTQSGSNYINSLVLDFKNGDIVTKNRNDIINSNNIITVQINNRVASASLYLEFNLSNI